MLADDRFKRFGTNLHKKGKMKILKTAAIFGANNAGKTCLASIMKFIRDTILDGHPSAIRSNFFNGDDDVSRFGVTFTSCGHIYSYDFSAGYDHYGLFYPHERFAEIGNDGNEAVWFERDAGSGDVMALDEGLGNVMGVFGFSNILIHVADNSYFEILGKAEEVLMDFAHKIEIIESSDDIMAEPCKTLSVMKENSGRSMALRSMVRNAGLGIEDFTYDGEELISCSKGMTMPSALWDSSGARRFEALAGYIVESFYSDKILVVDSLDAGLDSTLERAIVAAFNSDANEGSQLIFTLHDLSLMDDRKLFRKDQIWFLTGTEERTCLYPLSALPAGDSSSSLRDRYIRGELGPIPSPDFMETLSLIAMNRKTSFQG